MYPNKSVDECFSDQRTYSNSHQGMDSKKACGKSNTESGKNFYDSSRTDSGFISGVNIASEQNLSPDDLSSQVSEKLESDIGSETEKQSDTFMRLDSGLDVGLNEQFSELTLEQKEQSNDIHKNVKNKLMVGGLLESRIVVSNFEDKPKFCEISVQHPWQFYFQQDDDGDTRLHIAIIQGCADEVCSMIRMAPHPLYLDILNDVVQSPLHLAVLTHQSRVVRNLIVAGASFEGRDRHGNTPLHLACEMGDLECVKALTEPIVVSEVKAAGLCYTGYTKQVPQDFEEKNYEGKTCLHLAAYGGYLEILRYLIQFGADVNAREGKSGRTVLHYSVESGNRKLLRFLLEDGSKGPNGLLIDTPDYAGRTAYQLACVLDSTIAAVLLERGASFDVEDIDEDDHPDHNLEDISEDDYPDHDMEEENEIISLDNMNVKRRLERGKEENFQTCRKVVPV